jgi:zinc transporter ZupT
VSRDTPHLPKDLPGVGIWPLNRGNLPSPTPTATVIFSESMAAVELYVWLPLTLVTLAVLSLISLVAIGVVPFLKWRKLHLYTMQLLLALAVAALMGDAALHLIPHAFGESDEHLEEWYHEYVEPYKPSLFIDAALGQLSISSQSDDHDEHDHHSEEEEQHSHATGIALGLLFLIGYFFFLVLDRGTCWFTSLLIARLKARAAQNHGDSSENDEGNDNGESSSQVQEMGESSTNAEDNLANNLPPVSLGELSLPGESGDDCELCEARAHDSVGGSQIELLSADSNDHVHDVDGTTLEGEMAAEKDTNTTSPLESTAEFAINVDETKVEKVGVEDKTLRYQVAILSLIGDVMHNLFDGIAIAAAFASSLPLGISTALAVALHEIPQEISDIAIMYSSGLPIPAIVGLNVLVSCSAFVGVLIFFILQALTSHIVMWLLPLIAGSFVYMAASVCVPLLNELNAQTEGNSYIGAVMQSIGYVLGVAAMLILAVLE